VAPLQPTRLTIGLGLLLVVVLGVLSWIGYSSLRFRQRETPFVTAFVQDLSVRWSLEDVRPRLDARFLAQAQTARGRGELENFRRLGTLVAVRDLQTSKFLYNPAGSAGIFAFAGEFAQGTAGVRVTLVEKAGQARVLAIHIADVRYRAGVTDSGQPSGIPAGR
jgi:hypothetical protein